MFFFIFRSLRSLFVEDVLIMKVQRELMVSLRLRGRWREPMLWPRWWAATVDPPAPTASPTVWTDTWQWVTIFYIYRVFWKKSLFYRVSCEEVSDQHFFLKQIWYFFFTFCRILKIFLFPGFFIKSWINKWSEEAGRWSAWTPAEEDGSYWTGAGGQLQQWSQCQRIERGNVQQQFITVRHQETSLQSNQSWHQKCTRSDPEA